MPDLRWKNLEVGQHVWTDRQERVVIGFTTRSVILRWPECYAQFGTNQENPWACEYDEKIPKSHLLAPKYSTDPKIYTDAEFIRAHMGNILSKLGYPGNADILRKVAELIGYEVPDA